jgi:hypothetical protein
MESAQGTAKDIMRKIYRQEHGIAPQIVDIFIKCDDAGLVSHVGDEIPRDRVSLDAYAHKLFHDGMAQGWIHRPQ